MHIRAIGLIIYFGVSGILGNILGLVFFISLNVAQLNINVWVIYLEFLDFNKSVGWKIVTSIGAKW